MNAEESWKARQQKQRQEEQELTQQGWVDVELLVQPSCDTPR